MLEHRIDCAKGFECACGKVHSTAQGQRAGPTRIVYDNACMIFDFATLDQHHHCVLTYSGLDCAYSQLFASSQFSLNICICLVRLFFHMNFLCANYLTGNLLMYCLTREPGIIDRYSFFVDTFHHKGHTNCSLFLAHKSDPVTHFRNSSTNEVKNRLHICMKRVAAFPNQPRFLVSFLHIAQVQLAINQIIHLGGRASGTAKLVVDKSIVQTLVNDGVMVNLTAKHVWTGNRPRSVTPKDLLRRVKSLISCNERLIISDAKARKGRKLHELLKP